LVGAGQRGGLLSTLGFRGWGHRAGRCWRDPAQL